MAERDHRMEQGYFLAWLSVDSTGGYDVEPGSSEHPTAPHPISGLTGEYVTEVPDDPRVLITSGGRTAAEAKSRVRAAAVVVAGQVQQGTDLRMALGCVVKPDDVPVPSPR